MSIGYYIDVEKITENERVSRSNYFYNNHNHHNTDPIILSFIVFSINSDTHDTCNIRSTLYQYTYENYNKNIIDIYCLSLMCIPNVNNIKSQNNKPYIVLLTNNVGKKMYALCIYNNNNNMLFVFLTTHPFFELHFNTLNKIANCKTKMFVNSEEYKLLVDYCKIQIDQIYQIGQIDRENELIIKYGIKRCLLIWSETSKLLRRPILQSEKLFKIILSAILLEKSTVFISSDYQLLSSIILCTTSFIYPFENYNPIITILPKELINYLDSPVPFIYGVDSVDFDINLVDVYKNIIFINLDKLQVINNNLNNFIPNISGLYKSIQFYTNSLDDCLVQNNLTYSNIVRFIITIFYDFFTNLFNTDKMFKYCVRNVSSNKSITVFLKELFLLSMVNKNEYQFWVSFFETQLFSEFINKQVSYIDTYL
jgi:hypothetical protein